jgi:hypothetical protein
MLGPSKGTMVEDSISKDERAALGLTANPIRYITSHSWKRPNPKRPAKLTAYLQKSKYSMC